MQSINNFIDFTLLKADANLKDFENLCKVALERKYFSVCVAPYMVSYCKKYLKNSDVKVITVAGFPLGYNDTKVKLKETETALSCGADEIDMVVNISAFKSGNYQYIEKEIKDIKNICNSKILKAIIETAYLEKEEIIKISKIVASGGADFVKTSTGYASSGAKLEDIKIIKESIPENIKIKAAGGIKTYEQVLSFVNAGVSRIGTSSII